eukprot:maker-scaffold148_size310697-snap-gene-1.18 protein:Tk10301 transcript:maker-scaffold148_size310697-snap-gene-1.18-mRNA-1 annotation:"PREDICTED: myophilin-like"
MAAFSKRLMNTMNSYFDPNAKPQENGDSGPIISSAPNNSTKSARKILKVQGPILAEISKSSILSDKMPDAPFGLRPVVRKVSRTNQDLVGRFEKPPTSYSTSRSTSSSSLLSRSRPGSVKAGSSKTQRDVTLENKVLKWIMSVINEEANTDYDHFIQDGSVLSKVMTSIVFNSVPMEDIDQTWGSNPAHDRVTAVIREIKRYGVVDVFEPEDLIEMKNIPKVTKCLAQLSKLMEVMNEAGFRIKPNSCSQVKGQLIVLRDQPEVWQLTRAQA